MRMTRIGAGHNIAQEVVPGTNEADLTAVQTIERDATEFAEGLGLKLVVAQSNVEGEFGCGGCAGSKALG